ncbi:MAG TPA: hypothetical protein HA341_05755 [Halobacteria archaeon]|jgi:predicted small secreted protein|nr:hypothetical protein [Halobacteria archaeon]HIH78411.1 hypothetical protein [Halobacteria archaeon]
MKTIYDLRSYMVRENKLQDFINFYGEKALPLIKKTLKDKGVLVGHWITQQREIVDLDTRKSETMKGVEVNYMLAFDNKTDHDKYWEDFLRAFSEYQAEYNTLCYKMDNRVLESTKYNPIDSIRSFKKITEI